jgi:hypothetical protein
MKVRYPAVELAYPFVKDSYDVLLKRIDTLDGKIQAVISLGVTLTLAIPVFTAGKGLSYRSPFFIAAICFFFIAMTMGLIARLYGSVKLITPQKLFQHFLHLSEWEFKKDLIYHAGEDYARNIKLLKLRANLLNLMTVFLAAEAVALAAWAASVF